MYIFYYVLFSCPVFIRGQNILPINGLIVVDQYFIHQLPFNDSMKRQIIEHEMYVEEIGYLAARRYHDSIMVVFGGEHSGYIAYLLQTDMARLSSINFAEKNMLPVVNAKPGFAEDEIYGMTLAGQVVRFNLTDGSVEWLWEFSEEDYGGERLLFQIDYNNLTLCILEFYEHVSRYVLMFYHIDGNWMFDKELSNGDKFQVDFSSDEIFSIEKNILYHGKIDLPDLINMSEMWTAPDEIIDMTVTANNVYLVVRGLNEVVMIDRINSSHTFLDFKLNDATAIGSLYDRTGPDDFSPHLTTPGVDDDQNYIDTSTTQDTISEQNGTMKAHVRIAKSLPLRPSAFTLTFFFFIWITLTE